MRPLIECTRDILTGVASPTSCSPSPFTNPEPTAGVGRLVNCLTAVVAACVHVLCPELCPLRQPSISLAVPECQSAIPSDPPTWNTRPIFSQMSDHRSGIPQIEWLTWLVAGEQGQHADTMQHTHNHMSHLFLVLSCGRYSLQQCHHNTTARTGISDLGGFGGYVAPDWHGRFNEVLCLSLLLPSATSHSLAGWVCLANGYAALAGGH